MSFTSYVLTPTQFSDAPRNKLPFITIEYSDNTKETITDSHFIIKTFTERKVFRDLDAALTTQQRADSSAFLAWTEHLLYPVVVTTRFARETNFQVMRATIPIPVPAIVKWFIMWFLRRNIVAQMWKAGFGRYAEKEQDELIQEWVDGVCAKLELNGGKKWIMGAEEPTLVDITVWGFLANALEVGSGNEEFKAMILRKQILVEYVKRGANRWFQEYDLNRLLK
ncbi:hypothetical protein HK098_003556 [Nowakowskiella sp. JEL0407]|nr:hypothetical protein HK098_003556 [Nowakowskiella sp. JEL0407]